MKRKNKEVKVITAIILISVFFAIAPTITAAQSDNPTLNKIQKAIDEKGAKWTAGETSVSGLSVEEKKQLCGAKIGTIPKDAVVLNPPTKVSYGTFDWRSVNGYNWVTPVEDQGSCGSCWIFGSTAAFETQINIDANDPTIDFDASEQNILSCSGGGDCTGGYPEQALSYIRDNGVPDDACLPYQADDTVPCSDTCLDWQDRVWTFENIGVPGDHTTGTYKALLETHGPMVVVLNVGEDLFFYTGGIYEPVWTSEDFGGENHCVMLVGYDEPYGCWIIKNSWGTDWGENGYGRVYYGHLEQYERAYVVMDTSGPNKLPDLVVTDKFETLLGDNTFTVTYTVCNAGEEDADASTTYIYINGYLEVTAPASALAAGQSEQKTVGPFACPCGTIVNVAVCADNDNDVVESDETNNCMENDYPCPSCPDLTITDKFETLLGDGNFTVNYTVANIGEGNAGASITGIYINGGLGVISPVSALAAGASEQKTVGPFDCPCGTTVTVTVCADNDNDVVESDETNNCTENYLECPSPDIEVNKTVWNPEIEGWVDFIPCAEIGINYTFKCWLHNNGSGTNLSNISFWDILPDSLEYADNARMRTPDGVWHDIHINPPSNHWSIDAILGYPLTLHYCENITIEFAATVVGSGYGCNILYVEAEYGAVKVPASDTACLYTPRREVYLEPQSSSAIYGHTVTADIWVDACEFKSGEITLTYNPTCANVTDYVPDTTNFPWSGWSHDEGRDKITFMTEQKTVTGNYKIGTLSVQCENKTCECTTALNFVEPSALFDPGGFKITTNWANGSFTCTVICGDVNYDGEIDMGDVGALHNCVQYGGPISNTGITDVQCGNGINMGDVGLLHNHVQYGFPQLNCCSL